MKHLILILAFLLCIGATFAQLVPVEIVNDAEDATGKTLVTMFRDLIRSSPAYELTYTKTDPHFVVKISTMDRYKGDAEEEGDSTIYNYMILLDMADGTQLYCYSQLGYAGKTVLDEVAYSIYTDLDEFVEGFKSMMAEDE